MQIDREQRLGILQAIDLLKRAEGKKDIPESKSSDTWRGKPPIPILAGTKDYSQYVDDLGKAGDLDDKELLRAFAEQVFGYIERFSPELMPELKDKYFGNS